MAVIDDVSCTMPKRTLENREACFDKIETWISQGYDSPATVATHLGVSRKTAARWIAIVKKRIVAASKQDREAHRAVALAQARKSLRMAIESHGIARNQSNSNAEVGAIRAALAAQVQIAKLLGLNVADADLSEADLDAEAAEALAKIPALNDSD